MFRIAGLLGIALFLTVTGCSLERPNAGGVTIKLEPRQEAAELLASFSGFPLSAAPSLLADPGSIDDFNCFAVNVTGEGITQSGGNLTNCTLHDNMAGRGVGI